MSGSIARVGLTTPAIATPTTVAPSSSFPARAQASTTGTSPSTSLSRNAPVHGPPSATEVRAAKLKKAAGDFESLLVKQLLKEAKIGGAEKENGYGDMAVDALASAVEKGGGLGLAKHIEQMVGGHDAHPPAPATASTKH